MNKEKRMIEDWSVASNDDGYTAPENLRVSIVGVVALHKGKPNQRVRTSYIVSAAGKEVTTRSGSVYTLGKVHEEYREWLKENRPAWDEENPITMLGSK